MHKYSDQLRQILPLILVYEIKGKRKNLLYQKYESYPNHFFLLSKQASIQENCCGLENEPAGLVSGYGLQHELLHLKRLFSRHFTNIASVGYKGFTI